MNHWCSFTTDQQGQYWCRCSVWRLLCYFASSRRPHIFKIIPYKPISICKKCGEDLNNLTTLCTFWLAAHIIQSNTVCFLCILVCLHAPLDLSALHPLLSAHPYYPAHLHMFLSCMLVYVHVHPWPFCTVKCLVLYVPVQEMCVLFVPIWCASHEPIYLRQLLYTTINSKLTMISYQS